MTGLMTVPTTQIAFVAPMPGFPDARSWALSTWGDDPSSPFTLLRSNDVEGLEFIVLAPFLFFPDYEPELDRGTVDALGLTGPEDVDVFVVLTLGEAIESTTANLMGPIVVNRTTGVAAQAILLQGGLSTKTPLVASAA